MQGALLFSSRKAQLLRNETYLSYVVLTKDEAQRRRWTFCKVVKFKFFRFHVDHCLKRYLIQLCSATETLNHERPRQNLSSY